jgi:hypothetical protein
MPGDLNSTSPFSAMRRSTLVITGPTVSNGHLTVGLRGDVEEGFCLAVELLQVQADRAVEGKQVGPDRLARGIGDAHAREAEHIA